LKSKSVVENDLKLKSFVKNDLKSKSFVKNKMISNQNTFIKNDLNPEPT